MESESSSTQIPRPSRPPMLPHSMSLGTLPSPSFGSLPPGQRSVPAVDALARLGAANMDRAETPGSEGGRTPGTIGENRNSRRNSYEPWSTAGGGGDLGEAQNGVICAHTPERKAVGTPTTARSTRASVTWEDGTAPGDPSAALADLRRNSVARMEGASSPAGRPTLNRAPGSRDNLTSMGGSPNTIAVVSQSSVRKGLGLGVPTSASVATGLGFNIAETIPESEAVSSPMQPRATAAGRSRMGSASLEVPDANKVAAFGMGPVTLNGLRRASASSFVPFPQTDPLASAMNGLSVKDSAGQMPGTGRMSFNAGSPEQAYRSSGALGHRQSLPAAFFTPNLQSGADGRWNPYYIRSQYTPPDQVGAASPYVASGSYDPRRDSGYGPSPPQAGLDARRNSYSPNLVTSPALGNLRRSQSAWYIHDAFANPQQQTRHSSFSYAPSVSSLQAAWSSQYGGSPQLGYGSLSSPSVVSMDLPLAGGGVFGSPLLAQQQLLNEARRQSLARHSFDFGQAGIVPGAFGLGYAIPPASYPSLQPRMSFDSGRGVARSPILEEFRANKHRRWELRDMLGHIVEFAGDQLGSRHIQSKLDTATSDEKDLVFAEIYPNVLQLSMDVFANYVVQKFFEQGNQSQKAQLADALRGHVLSLSLQMYGCRVVQKALEHVLVDQQHALVKELEGEVMQCAKDQNANHVLQRSLERVDAHINRFITDAFAGQAFQLATHPYGCRVLQRVFEHVPEAQARPLLDELHRYAHQLMTDQYGNYVAQWIIMDGTPEDGEQMVSKVRGQVLILSKHKFASNVVEKAILKASDEDLRAMLDELLAPRVDGASTIGIMLKDAFANFPLQKFLLVARPPQRAQLFDETATQLAHMRKYSLSYGRYLVAIDKLISQERGTTPFHQLPSSIPIPGQMVGQEPGELAHLQPSHFA